jgi:hypothetical protein
VVEDKDGLDDVGDAVGAAAEFRLPELIERRSNSTELI